MFVTVKCLRSDYYIQEQYNGTDIVINTDYIVGITKHTVSQSEADILYHGYTELASLLLFTPNATLGYKWVDVPYEDVCRLLQKIGADADRFCL